MRKREIIITVRVTPQEKSSYERNAKKCRLSLSGYIRQLANGYQPKESPPIEYFKLTRLLSEMYSAFNLTGEIKYAKLAAEVLMDLQKTISPEEVRRI